MVSTFEGGGVPDITGHPVLSAVLFVQLVIFQIFELVRKLVVTQHSAAILQTNANLKCKIEFYYVDSIRDQVNKYGSI